MVAMLATPVFAQNAGFSPRQFGIDEVRGGATFSELELIPKSIVVLQTSSLNVARLDSAQFDVLFRLPDVDVFRWLGSPRPAIGGVVSLSGHESLVHVGLDWHVPIFSTPFYLEAGIGLGIHNGYYDHAPPGFRNLGCNPLFHWEYGVGANLNEHVTLTAELQHMSSVGQCNPNEGVNNIGVALGWKF